MPVLPGVTPAVTNPQPTTIRLRKRSSQSYRRLTDTGGVTSSIDPTTKLRSGCLARDNGYPSEEMPTSRRVAA